MPLVSILIANLNNGQYIRQTLESAVSQTYGDIEIVIVDDGSSDNSIQIIQDFINEHADSPILFSQNDASGGCGRVKRQLVELSHGDYFAFLDPEDTISPDAVAILMKEHEKQLYSIVYSTHYLCDEKLNPYAISDWPGEIAEGQSHLTSTTGHISAFALCNRSCYNNTEGINPKLFVAEDYDLYLKMEEVAPVHFVNRPLYYYRHHATNTSWNDNRRAVNLQYRHLAISAAYHRRKKSNTIPNLTRFQYHQECLSYNLQLRKYYCISRKYSKALFHFISALPYIYTYHNHFNNT